MIFITILAIPDDGKSPRRRRRRRREEENTKVHRQIPNKVAPRNGTIKYLNRDFFDMDMQCILNQNYYLYNIGGGILSQLVFSENNKTTKKREPVFLTECLTSQEATSNAAILERPVPVRRRDNTCRVVVTRFG